MSARMTRDVLLFLLWILSVSITTLVAINIEETVRYLGWYLNGSVPMAVAGSLGIFVFPTLGFAIRYRKSSNRMIGVEIAILTLLFTLFLTSAIKMIPTDLPWSAPYRCRRFQYCRTYETGRVLGWILVVFIVGVILVDAFGGYNLEAAGQLKPEQQHELQHKVDNFRRSSNDTVHA